MSVCVCVCVVSISMDIKYLGLYDSMFKILLAIEHSTLESYNVCTSSGASLK